MTQKGVSDWERYAVVTHIVRILGNSQALGRKAFQKIVYLLQELTGVPLGFRYTFYTYGVYSFELASTLGAVENMRGIVANYDSVLGAYNLTAGDEAARLEQKGGNLIAEFEKQIGDVVDFARGKTGKELELSSTIIFVAITEGLNARSEEHRLMGRVAELKPRFKRSQIESAMSELRSREFLPTN